MIFRATIADCDLLAAIHASAFAGPEAWSRDVFSLQVPLFNVFGLVCPAGGMILVRVAADEAEILTLAVRPDVRRGGIGGLLLGTATSQAAALGAKTVFLEVSVTNIAARQLYTRAGFVEVGRRGHYYSDGSDALVLRFDLEAGC